MPVADYFILVQNLFLVLIITCPAWILCKGKKKASPNKTSKESSEAPAVKSSTKPPTTDAASSQVAQPKEDGKKDGEGPSNESKEGDKKDGGGSGSVDKSKENSQRPFPKFEMPTESKKNKKLQENEKDKKEKMKTGFYQPKSDEDDTLEKVDSLHVEQSDKTKRSQKNKNKK